MNNKSDTPLEVAMRYFNEWTKGAMTAAGACLDEGIKFDMPINEYHTKEDFMSAVIFTAQHSSSIKMLASFGNENEAVLLYEFVFATAGKITIAEHFVVRNGKINFIRHIHDTHALRKLMK